MGIENNECIIATTSSRDVINQFKDWILENLEVDDRRLISFIESRFNGKCTIVFAPDGSKKGWLDADIINAVRDEIVDYFDSCNLDDGSNVIDWVEVGYGEYGQTILRGNCKNMYSDTAYHGKVG